MTAIAFARAAWAASASSMAKSFVFLLSCRNSMASFFHDLIWAILPVLSSMSSANTWILELPAPISSPNAVTFAALASFDTIVLFVSKSHHILCSSSSFCSAMSLKIIFWIMLITWSKGPAPIACSLDVTFIAKSEKDFERERWASLRNKSMALDLGSSAFMEMEWTCTKSTVEVGKSLTSGGAVWTPITLLRIHCASSRALIS
mmetsp:Transcript_106359/g.184934  ORF Transcript_106359/g.184934 Transcript_106359/m.184934 type:complete len:204 (-) Transcript_106359:1081-1692(-)